jgi:DNA-binding NarL/FixJ family response regulator
MTAVHRIALVDDHRMFAEGFSAVLEKSASGHAVVTFDEPVAFLETLSGGARFDLVIIDLVMKGMNGLALLSAISRTRPPPKVLMLSGISSAPPIAEMKRLGASGFVAKSGDIAGLLAAVEAVLAGGTVFPEDDAMGLARTDEEDATWERADVPPELGPRQLEVLQLIGQGATNREIADRLCISENTVKSHMRAIFEALDVRTRTACHHKAVLLGLL